MSQESRKVPSFAKSTGEELLDIFDIAAGCLCSRSGVHIACWTFCKF